MKKIMITGASGILGQEMIELLTKEKVLHRAIKSRIDNINVK